MTDAKGNITTNIWTDDDQLAAVTLPNGGGIVTNTYNGDGLRFSRTDSSGTNSYLWNNQILEAQLGAGNTVSLWYNQGMGQYGDIISTRDAAVGASSPQLYDASGNLNQTTDASANITATLSYHTFGSVTDNSGPANPTVAWQGKQGYQFEQALGVAGLQYVRQRWYDPATRQFISPDPLGFGGGDVNLFRYAENNPINRNDPGGTALEYIGNNLYWKVHPAETAWNIAHELTGHGAWYRKIFQRPAGGFSHLHPGELLVVNPINEGLIANHHWIAEPGQPAVPTIFVRGPQPGGSLAGATPADATAPHWYFGGNYAVEWKGTTWLMGNNPVGSVPLGGLTRNCPQGALSALNKALANARSRFLSDVSRDEIAGTQLALGRNAVGQLDLMTDVGVVGSVGGIVGDIFKGGEALYDARRAIKTLRDIREAGPLFESAYQGARESYSVSGAVGAMESGSVAATAIKAAASTLTSYLVFGSQAKALSSAFNSAFSDALNGRVAGLGTAYDVLFAINGAMAAAYSGGSPLPRYITPMTRELYAARVAAAIRNYNAALAH